MYVMYVSMYTCFFTEYLFSKMANKLSAAAAVSKRKQKDISSYFKKRSRTEDDEGTGTESGSHDQQERVSLVDGDGDSLLNNNLEPEEGSQSQIPVCDTDKFKKCITCPKSFKVKILTGLM